MPDKVDGVLETPVKPEVLAAEQAHEPFIDNPRRALEAEVIKKNEEIPSPEPDSDEPVKDDVKADSKLEESDDPVERIKKSVQKRIDKVVAQKKSVEEELAETRAELEKLKNRVSDKPESKPDDKREPTDAEIDAALEKAYKDGDYKFAAQITRYQTTREANRIADERIKAIEDKQTKQTQAQSKQQTDWVNLNRDYLVYTDDGKPDMTHPMNLANQNGLLYKTALSLYSDPDLKKTYYNDSDTIAGFRKAVNDASREIYEQELYKPVKKTVEEVRRPKPRTVLADPSSDSSEETQSSQVVSDADKVREEIKNRNKFHEKRTRF